MAKKKTKIRASYKKLGAQATPYPMVNIAESHAPEHVNVAFSFMMTGQTAVLNSALELSGDGLYVMDKTEIEANVSDPYALYGQIMADAISSQLTPDVLGDEYGCGWNELTVTLQDVRFLNRLGE
jgi:hypothetical protein